MEFNFSEDQTLLAQAVRDFLEGEASVDKLRANWETETGRSAEFWQSLAEVGVPGLLIPEDQGGLAMNEIDTVLVLEETGRAGLAEPVIATAAVAAPLLRESGNAAVASEWLPKIAGGEAIVAVSHSMSPFVDDAHIADLLLLNDGDAIHAVPSSAAQITAQAAGDPSARLFTVEYDSSAATVLAEGAAVAGLRAAAFDRGALACSAQLLGICDQLIVMAVDYASQRKQFGVPIGSFQAVKHQLANVKVKLEYARSLVYRAAHSVAHATACRSIDVSMAKIAASEAAMLGSSTALQVHGAIGYTWEQDLHVWMRRAWTLDLAWGDGAWHRDRLADAVIDEAMPAESFGFSALGA